LWAGEGREETNGGQKRLGDAGKKLIRLAVASGTWTIKNDMDILIIRVHFATRFLQAKFRRKKCICDKCEESVNS
jgi:hypothetical protein